jgi:predicted nucleic acid-binding protein
VSTPARVVVIDSNVLINLMHVSRLGLLGSIPKHEFVVPDHVREEITNPGQISRLDATIAEGSLKLESITDLDAMTTFAELTAHIGRGEAACIAIASQRGWCIASDEKRRFRREAEARVGSGRILGTVELFVLAIEAGLLTVEHADADKLVLESRRFKVAFASFRDLVKSHGVRRQ